MHSDSLHSVFSEWKLARARFTASLQELFDATSALESAYQISSDNSTRKAVATTIETDRKSFTHHETQLLDTRASLSRIRNLSITPAHVLPPDILGKIFTMVSHMPGASRSVLTFVCHYWRRTAIDLRSLWGSLTFNVARYYSRDLARGRLWLERAHSAPLRVEFTRHLHINARPSETQIRTCLALLAPRMRQLSSLVVIYHDDSLLSLILACWLQNGTPGSLNDLRINKRHGYGNKLFKCLSGIEMVQGYTLDAFLSPIRTLALADTDVDWSSSMFAGLTELQLHDVETATGSQIARLLTDCPDLHTLKLSKVELEYSGDEGVAPAKHPKLRKLVLSFMGPESLAILFQAFLPTSGQLDLCIEDWLPHATLPHFDGSQVQVFRLVSMHCEPVPLHDFLALFPYMHTFVCQNLDFDESMLEALSGRCMKVEPPRTLPKLHTIWLGGCIVRSEAALRNVVLAQSIRRLGLYGCRIRAQNPHCGEHIPSDFTEGEHVCTPLTELVPYFKIDNTRMSSCSFCVIIS